MTNKLHLDIQKKIVQVTLDKMKKLATSGLQSNALKNKYLEVLTEYRTKSISYFRHYYKAAKRYFMFMERTIEKGGGKGAADAGMFK